MISPSESRRGRIRSPIRSPLKPNREEPAKMTGFLFPEEEEKKKAFSEEFDVRNVVEQRMILQKEEFERRFERLE